MVHKLEHQVHQLTILTIESCQLIATHNWWLRDNRLFILKIVYITPSCTVKIGYMQSEEECGLRPTPEQRNQVLTGYTLLLTCQNYAPGTKYFRILRQIN